MSNTEKSCIIAVVRKAARAKYLRVVILKKKAETVVPKRRWMPLSLIEKVTIF